VKVIRCVGGAGALVGPGDDGAHAESEQMTAAANMARAIMRPLGCQKFAPSSPGCAARKRNQLYFVIPMQKFTKASPSLIANERNSAPTLKTPSKLIDCYEGLGEQFGRNSSRLPRLGCPRDQRRRSGIAEKQNHRARRKTRHRRVPS
jgi:hypothetical protein